MASSGTTQRSAPAASAAARASSTRSTFPARSPTTVLSCAAARRRYAIGPDYRGLPWPDGGAGGGVVRRPRGPPEKRGGHGMRNSCGAKPARLRAPDRRGTGHPLRPAVVHRRAGDAQGVQHHLDRARGRPRRGDDVRRLRHRRLQPGPRSRCARPPRPEDLSAAALAPRRRPGGPRLLRHRQPRRNPVRGRSPARPPADAGEGPGGRLHLLRRPRGRVLLLRGRRSRPRPPHPRLGVLLRPDAWPT